ncbi:hypothetical protein MKW92_040501 [Papaver armeniacum]|nr:hypothetical protein MKW92_040501 [Papaver armeniacum]
MRLLQVATCNLNQWAMDFDCNLKNIKESIKSAKQAGAVIRLGPELEIAGYGCEDHLLELDTVTHSIGMRVIRGSQAQRYNCQVLCYNRKILMIRLKFCLADDGNYRELRWFTAWKQTDQLEEFQLPPDLHDRHDAFKGATHTSGGVYMYSNQQGCDGGRLYYDGFSCVVVNGKVVAQGSQFCLEDVEVLTKVSYITAPYKLCQSFDPTIFLSSPLKIVSLFQRGGSLLRSGASGFLLPLSGRADSSSVAAIVGCMCQLVVKEIANGNEQVKADEIRIGHYTDGQYPTDSKEFAKRIFYTVFMGAENSSDTTRSRAKLLAAEIGSWHLDVSLDSVISSMQSLFQTLTVLENNLGLQNIQARTRMVLAYMLAYLLPWDHIKPGFFSCIGYLQSFLKWAAVHLDYSSLAEIEAAPPTLDEIDMGMTYEELSNLCSKWGGMLSPLDIANKVKYFFKYYSVNQHKMTTQFSSNYRFCRKVFLVIWGQDDAASPAVPLAATHQWWGQKRRDIQFYLVSTPMGQVRSDNTENDSKPGIAVVTKI